MFRVLKRLAWFFKENWQRYTIAIIVLSIVNVLEVIPPRLIGYSIDLIRAGTISGERLVQIIIFYSCLLVTLYFLTFIWINKVDSRKLSN